MDLFENKKEIIYFFLISGLIFALNVGLKYYNFTKIKAKPYLNSAATLLASEQKLSKNGKVYYSNIFATPDFRIYSYAKAKLEKGAYSIKIPTKKLDFKSYLKGRFFSAVFDIKAISSAQTLRQKLVNLVYFQHQSPKAGELYSALFFATPLSKELRSEITNWGIAHLLAISGFHLGLLFAIFYFLLKRPYSYFQQRFFPHRNRDIDLSLFILALGAFYLWILDFTPSFFRSYLMSIFGFILLVRGIKIFAFGTLLLCVVFALCSSPSLIFSIGFYFSCLGVFFILVYIRHFGEYSDFKSKAKMLAHALCFELFVFSAMNIPVFYFFPQASIFQLSVIVLSYAFVVFYPLSIVLHLFGFGGLMDSYLLDFLAYATKGGEIFIPTWLFVLFNLSLIFAVKYKYCAVFVALSGAVIYFWGLFI